MAKKWIHPSRNSSTYLRKGVRYLFYAALNSSPRPRTLTPGVAFAPRPILVMDGGYVDYVWFTTLTRRGALFVTRLKDHAIYRVGGDPRGPGESGES